MVKGADTFLSFQQFKFGQIRFLSDRYAFDKCTMVHMKGNEKYTFIRCAAVGGSSCSAPGSLKIVGVGLKLHISTSTTDE